MPVKIAPATPKATTKAPDLDTTQLALIKKLAMPLAKTAKSLKLAQDTVNKTTFELYANFRKVAREHFEDNAKAVRALAVTVLASVYDVPATAIHITGNDQARWVYPDEYMNAKGKKVPHPKAGQDLDDDADDDDKEIAVHPNVPGAARLYNLATRLLKVTIPADPRAKELVDEALEEDGTCQCGEQQLYQIANGSSREITPKGKHGGARPAKVWDEKSLTAELEKLLRRAWNGDEVVPGCKGTLTVTELTECTVAAIGKFEAEVEKVEKAQKKAAGKGGKAAPESED